MLLRGQCQALFSDTWLVLCWHWVCHVPRACHGSRETRGLSNIRGISWCHHDRDWGGWLGSEEALTTITMSRVYIGDQDSAIIRESRRRGVLSPRHSNTSSSLRSIINTSKHAIVHTTSHGALNFERNTVIELFKCPPVSIYSSSLHSGNLIFIITKPNWISIDGRCRRADARWAVENTISLATLQFEIILL